MVSEAFITNTVTLVAVAFLIVTFLLPKRLRFALHGFILLAFGMIPILYRFGVVPFTFGDAGILKYVLSVVIVFTGRSLIIEGVKEEGVIRWVSIIGGIIIIVLATLPVLSGLGALTFALPEYPVIVNYVIYVFASLLLFIGIFVSKVD